MFPFVGAYLRSLSSNFYRLHYGKKSKVNDIRPGADPVNERIKSQLVAKHGQDFKSKVVARQTGGTYLVSDDTNYSIVDTIAL